MQWDASENAFNRHLWVGKSYKDINVENEIDGPIFKFYSKELICMRKEMPIISRRKPSDAFEDSQGVTLLNAT